MAQENVVGIKVQASGAAAVKAELARVDAALRATQARVEAVNRAMASVGNGLARGVGIAARAGLLAVAAGATLLTVSLVRGVKAAIEMADGLDELSAQTSVSVSNLAVLQQAFELAGVGADKVGASISKMLKTLGDAKEGDAVSDRLNQLGTTLERIRALDPAGQFEAIGKAIGEIRDPAEQTAAAVALFGKSGAELLPLFKDGGSAMATARTQLGGLPAVLERNARAMTELADATDGWHLKLVQLGAGFLDQVLPAFDGLAARINAIDLTGFGQKIGTWSMLLANAFKDSKVGEFLALNLEVGFEAFLAFARKELDKPGTWQGAGNVLATVLTDSLKLGLTVQSKLWEYLYGAAIHLGELLKQGIADALNVLIKGVGAVLNLAVDLVNTITGANLDHLKLDKLTVVANSWEESLRLGSEYAKLTRDRAIAALEATKQRARAGLGGTDSGGKSAAERMGDLFRQQEALTAGARVRAAWADAYAKAEALATREMGKQVDASADITAELDDWISDIDEWEQALKRAADHAKAIADWQAKTGDTYAGRVGQDFAAYGVSRVHEEQTGFGGADAGGIAGLQQALMDFGTTAQQVGEAIRQNIGGAIDAVSAGITAAVLQTKTWGAAFLEVGRAILENVVNAIIKMAVTWVAQRIIMATAGRAIAAATAASLAPIALAQAALWATPAALATISSYGGAAAAAPGQIALAQGVTLAQAMATFATGGYTGDMGRDAFAGAVHGQEFVFSAPVTASLGRDDLEALHRGQAEITRPGAGGAGTKFNVAVMSSRAEALAFFRSTEGRTVVLDIFRQNRHEFL